ncbi:MAG: hypothetical protein ABIZ72_08890 [Candidatus Limnocylindrales bacterium]
MIDLQLALVADHIAGLEREGTAIRAERVRDHLRAHASAGTDAVHPVDLPSRRVRLGRLFVSVGEAIAGSARPASSAGRALATGLIRADAPCNDGNERLATAA